MYHIRISHSILSLFFYYHILMSDINIQSVNTLYNCDVLSLKYMSL